VVTDGSGWLYEHREKKKKTGGRLTALAH